LRLKATAVSRMVLWAPGQAAHVHPPQAVVLNQVPKHRLDGALADAAFALSAPALLAQLGLAVSRIVNRAVSLLAFGYKHAHGLARAMLAVAARGPIDFVPAPVWIGIVFLKG
jgi:hypothetical protein